MKYHLKKFVSFLVPLVYIGIFIRHRYISRETILNCIFLFLFLLGVLSYPDPVCVRQSYKVYCCRIDKQMVYNQNYQINSNSSCWCFPTCLNTLPWCWGLSASVTWRAMPSGTCMLPAGPPKADRPIGRDLTKFQAFKNLLFISHYPSLNFRLFLPPSISLYWPIHSFLGALSVPTRLYNWKIVESTLNNDSLTHSCWCL